MQDEIKMDNEEFMDSLAEKIAEKLYKKIYGPNNRNPYNDTIAVMYGVQVGEFDWPKSGNPLWGTNTTASTTIHDDGTIN